MSFVFWESIFLFPFKMLSVLIHELWHSLVSVFFNVDWVEFHIEKNEIGKTIVKGSMPIFGFVLTALAGYIGTLLTGSLFLRLIIQKNLEDLIFFVFCGILFLISFILVRIPSLGFYVSFGWFFVLIIIYFLNQKFAMITFSIIQSFLIFYSFYDLLDFSKNPYKSDIGILYQFLQKQNISFATFETFFYVVSSLIVFLNIYIFYKLILSLAFTQIKLETSEAFRIENSTESQTESQNLLFDKTLQQQDTSISKELTKDDRQHKISEK